MVANRQGNDVSEHLKTIEDLAQKEVLVMQNQPFECSSTEFRQQLNAQSLPEGVYEYIEKRGLYGL